MVTRLVVTLAVAGSVCSTLLSAASTSWSERTMSWFQSNSRSTSAEPRLVIERTETSPGTAFTASSMGLVMVTCICSTGITPLSTPTTTRGKSVGGKTEMGTWNATYTPATISMAAKKKMVRVERASQKGFPVLCAPGSWFDISRPPWPCRPRVRLRRSLDLLSPSYRHPIRTLRP